MTALRQAVYEPPAQLATHRPRWQHVLRLDACAYCPLRPGGTLDHIEPRGKGGDNSMANLTGSCGLCNVEKDRESLLMFLLHRRFCSEQAR